MTRAELTIARPGSVLRWIIPSGLSAALVCGLLLWQHVERRESAQITMQRIDEIRNARIDLANGLLNLTLAGEPASPYRQDVGITLIHRALETIGRAMQQLGSAESPQSEPFRRSAADFTRLLQEIAPQRTTTPDQKLALRIAYGALERHADYVDSAVRNELIALAERADARFIPTLLMVAAVFVLIGCFVLRADQAQRLASLANVQAERKLSANEAQLRLYIEYAPVAFAVFDHQMNYLAASRRWITDFLPNLRGDLVGRNHYDLFPELTERWRQVHREGLAGAIVRCEEDRFERADGRVYWLRWEVRPWLNPTGSVGGIAIFSEEITARKQIELALRRNEATFRGAFANAAIGFVIASPNGQILDANRAYCELSGFAIEDLQKRSLAEQIHPDDRETARSAIKRMFNAECTDFRIENRHVHKSGEIFWVRKSLSVVQGDDEYAALLIALVEDITDRKRAERALRELNAELDRHVVERTAELTQANRELDSFAYAVSHDLRAPLRAMSGFSRAISEDFGDRLPAEGQQYLQQIELAARRMSELIDGILTLSRSTRGELAPDPVDLSQLAEQIAGEPSGDEPGAVALVTVEPGIRAIGDRRMLEVLLRNLFDNARKYSAKVASPRIRFYAEQRGGQTWACIADNGAGFNPAHAGRLFQPFQRLHRQDEFPGIGIGLATCQRIVHRHGGAIEATAAPGEGAVFRFTLPGMTTAGER